MINASIARRYARALFEVGLKANATEPLGQALNSVAQAMALSEELKGVMENPAINPGVRQTILAKLLEQMKLPTDAANLMRLLVDRNRMQYIEPIARAYRDLLDQQTNRLRARVTSAVPLEDSVVERIRKELAYATNKQVIVERVVDPRIIGGVITQLGSTVLDGSLRNQLESLRRQLTS